MADLLTVEVAKERVAELRRAADRHRFAAGDSRRLPVARNTALLAGAVAANAAIVELSAAVASISLVRLVDVGGLLGLGPAIVLAAGALAAVPAGRSMDRFGRAPVLAGGFAVGAASCGLAALGCAYGLTAAVLIGLAGVGVGSGSARLARTAASDMYPPGRRARAIGFVLFGAVFGAILGPAVFSPMLTGRVLDGNALASLWLAAGAFEIVGLALMAALRPDPKQIAVLLGHEPQQQPAGTARIGQLLRRPGVVTALVAGQASVGVMVAVMMLTGPIVVERLHHDYKDVFPIVGAQVLGMYALVIVVGEFIDRIGRLPALSGGLLLMGVSVSGLLWTQDLRMLAVALFALGLGWSVSFVAATAELADRATVSERGSLLGFNDLLGGATSAGLTLLGGLLLTAAGVTTVAICSMALVITPALAILLARPARSRRGHARQATRWETAG
jgi:MFS family permease